MTRRQPEEFSWRQGTRPKPLSMWERAPESPGFYELGIMVRGRFEPKYGGRASERTLRRRLAQHWKKSHHPRIAEHGALLWYRCMPLPSGRHARAVEAHYIAAFDYEWNARQEWAEHFALEPVADE